MVRARTEVVYVVWHPREGIDWAGATTSKARADEQAWTWGGNARVLDFYPSAGSLAIMQARHGATGQCDCCGEMTPAPLKVRYSVLACDRCWREWEANGNASMGPHDNFRPCTRHGEFGAWRERSASNAR